MCNDDWPDDAQFDLNIRPMVYNNKCQSTSTAKTPDPDTDTAWNDWLPMCGNDLSHGLILCFVFCTSVTQEGL